MNYKTVPVLYLFENVFYPETIIPLTLSDEPSKLLISESYKADQTIALYSTHGKARGIATIGRIISTENKPDGTLSAIVQGLERIQLYNITQHIPYPVYEYLNHPDIRCPQVLKEGSLERLYALFEDWLNRHVSNKHDRDVFLREINSPKKLVYNISLFMIKDVEMKLMFLECTSLSDRISILDAVLTGDHPESEDQQMAEAIKHFESLGVESMKSMAN